MCVRRWVGVLALCALWAAQVVAEPKVVARGLLKNMAVLEIDGVQRTLRAGKTSPEGVMLVSSSTKAAVIEVEGRRETLTLSRQIGGVAYSTPEKRVVRIARGVGGHYFTPGRINSQAVSFLVDTGATSVAMSALMAQKLRIDYRAGRPVNVQTANGVARGYAVVLQSVSVGTVKLSNVEAIVNDGAFPADILLGNSYLSRVEMNVDDGVLVLQAKF